MCFRIEFTLLYQFVCWLELICERKPNSNRNKINSIRKLASKLRKSPQFHAAKPRKSKQSGAKLQLIALLQRKQFSPRCVFRLCLAFCVLRVPQICKHFSQFAARNSFANRNLLLQIRISFCVCLQFVFGARAKQVSRQTEARVCSRVWLIECAFNSQCLFVLRAKSLQFAVAQTRLAPSRKLLFEVCLNCASNRTLLR